MADEPDLLAAEYVLGTLDEEQRRDFLRTLARNPAAVADVLEWRERFAPLILATPEVAPRPTLWARIEHAIGERAANDNGALRRWRTGAIAAALLAMVAGGVAWQSRHAAPDQPAAMAALSPGGGAPGMFITYDADGGNLRVVPVGLKDQPGRSLELWMIAGTNAPKSMGTMAANARPSFSGLVIDPKTEIIFAITIEPVGGSPTGAPTGPITYSGKLVAVSPAT